MEEWYTVKNSDPLLSPAILFYLDRIEANIEEMIRISGSPKRLRPHVKTYKCVEIVNLQVQNGITKFKCATIAEARMLAEAGIRDILIAYPLVGPVQKAFVQMVAEFPNSSFSVLIDHPDQLDSWNSMDTPIQFFVDLDAGMHRTGCDPITAGNLAKSIYQGQHILKGWHLYDGHIREHDPEERKKKVEAGVERFQSLIDHHEPIELVCGGSVTFPIHAAHTKRTLSPGTTLLWDHGYSSNFPDIPIVPAATLLTRIISKPGKDRICVDLGHKAVASEMSAPPVYFPQLPDAKIVVHSEEHLVLKTKQVDQLQIADVLYGIPYHICPTVALHEEAAVVKEGDVVDRWTIASRNRQYTL